MGYVEPYAKWFALELVFIAGVQVALQGGLAMWGGPQGFGDLDIQQRFLGIVQAALGGTFAQGSWEAFIGRLSEKFSARFEREHLIPAARGGAEYDYRSLARRQVVIANVRDLASLTASVIVTTLSLAHASGLPTLWAMVGVGVAGMGAYSWLQFDTDSDRVLRIFDLGIQKSSNWFSGISSLWRFRPDGLRPQGVVIPPTLKETNRETFHVRTATSPSCRAIF
jgi:hypothetical protein